MSKPRHAPYIWPTWITGLLSGESHCEWAAWFRAHFSNYAKAPKSIDLTKWTADHNDMLRTRAEALRQAGYTVYIEDQNSFALRGIAATLGGKADIVAIKDGDAVVIDAKSGQRRDKDVWQVLIYMLVLPLAVSHCKGLTLRGELEYKDGIVHIPPAQLDAKSKHLIRRTIERVSGTALVVVPSPSECKWCDLTKADCAQRIEVSEEGAAATDLW